MNPTFVSLSSSVEERRLRKDYSLASIEDRDDKQPLHLEMTNCDPA
jgi:hypothetical protein